MDVLVAAWVGSTNLGDELVFAGLARRLREMGARPVAVSVRPRATAAVHGVDAVGHGDARGLWNAAGRAGAVVLGGGGLVQDETSPYNLPYHLSRVWLARLRGTPWAGVGLGVGELRTRFGRALARTLRRAVAVSVRDVPSAALARTLGVGAPVLAADLALANPPPRVEVDDELVVALRPWGGGGGLVPVAAGRHRQAAPGWYVEGAARALDAVASRTGLAVRFVALQTDRDDALHRRVAERMRTPARCVVPDLGGVLAALASGRAVVAVRYHGAIGAVLGARPAVLVGYSPKVDALAGDLGAAGRLVPWGPDGLAGLPDAVEAVLGEDAAAADARERLVGREAGNRAVLERLLGP